MLSNILQNQYGVPGQIEGCNVKNTCPLQLLLLASATGSPIATDLLHTLLPHEIQVPHFLATSIIELINKFEVAPDKWLNVNNNLS